MGKIMDKALFQNASTPSEYAKAYRQLPDVSLTRDIKIAVLASYTAEILEPYIAVELAKKKFNPKIYFGPFNHFEELIFQPHSALYDFQPEVTILHPRLEDTHPDIIARFASHSVAELESITSDIVERQRSLIGTIRKHSTSHIAILEFGNINPSGFDFHDSPVQRERKEFTQHLNIELRKLTQEISGCSLISYMSVFNTIGLTTSVDPKLFYMARVPFSGAGQIVFGKSLARSIRAIVSPPAKCLVLDLDNTLWGGVIGEDGISGIQLGNDYPGNVFKAFQSEILGLRDQGVLLALASKNNEADAIEVFHQHTDCILKVDNFSSIQINWNDKASSIRKIADELNIGLDAIVFFDDNPSERDWVKKQLPEVSVVDVPKNPLGYIQALKASFHFDRISITSEDKTRPAKYLQEKKRKQAQSEAYSFDEFLTELDIRATVGLIDEVTVKRIEQLVNKTNQFNLTTKRYNAAGLIEITRRGGKVFWLSVKDCYGDSGLVGVAILIQQSNEQWLIDNFLMSCRVIGKKIETAFLHAILEQIRFAGGRYVLGQYIETKKNTLVATFYDDHQFKTNSENEWFFDFDCMQLEKPEFIEVHFSGDPDL